MKIYCQKCGAAIDTEHNINEVKCFSCGSIVSIKENKEDLKIIYEKINDLKQKQIKYSNFYILQILLFILLGVSLSVVYGTAHYTLIFFGVFIAIGYSLHYYFKTVFKDMLNDIILQNSKDLLKEALLHIEKEIARLSQEASRDEQTLYSGAANKVEDLKESHIKDTITVKFTKKYLNPDQNMSVKEQLTSGIVGGIFTAAGIFLVLTKGIIINPGIDWHFLISIGLVMVGVILLSFISNKTGFRRNLEKTGPEEIQG